MSFKEDAIKKAASFAADKIFSYIDNNPETGFEKILSFSEKLFAGRLFPAENFKKMKAGAADPNNIYTQLALNILRSTDRGLLKHMLLTLGVDAGYFGTKKVRANREKYNCNIPWIILG